MYLSKITLTAILCFMIFSAFFNSGMKKDSANIISREYCTEIGRFDLLFYNDEISGSYVLLPKKSLGSVWGILLKDVMTGRWLDADGQGDIIITFDKDFSWFTTSYRSDDEPEKWYKDQWHGQLRPDKEPGFSIGEKNYRCE